MNLLRIKGIFFRYFFTMLKGPQQLSDLFYWPFVDILLWGLTSSWIQKQSHASDLPLIILTGLIFWQITWRGSVDISMNLLQEFWNRNLVNMFSTPLKTSEWIIGVVVLCLCKLAVAVGFGVLMVYLLYSLNIFALGWAFLPFAALLLMFGWALGLYASGLIVYWGHQVEMLAWTLPFVFAPFSAVYYPVETLPSWAQKISWSLPTTYVFEGMRQILRGDPFPWSNFLMSFLLNLLFLCLSFFFFSWMFEKSRLKGLIRLE